MLNISLQFQSYYFQYQ